MLEKDGEKAELGWFPLMKIDKALQRRQLRRVIQRERERERVEVFVVCLRKK